MMLLCIGLRRERWWNWGSFELDGVLDDNGANQKYAIFDPIPRVEGVDASDDPLLEMRAALYLLSGKQRRAA
jgi:catalase